MFSMLPAMTLAAVSSAGVRARDGRIAAWMGRVSVIALLAHAARTYTASTGAPANQRRGDRAHRRRLEQVRDQQRSLPGVSVAERCGQRGNHGRRGELDERDQPHLAGAPVAVGEDQDRDPGRPLGEAEPEESRLDPAQRRVPHHRTEGRS